MFSPPEALIIILILIPTAIAALKGAPFVPTPFTAVQKMLELAKIKPGTTIVDLGCGDGRIVYLVSQKYPTCKVIGYELSPLVYLLAKIRQWFWKSRATIKFRDFRKENLKPANIIFCYLLVSTLKTFQKKFEAELSPGSKVISYAFPIGDWKPVYEEPRNKELGLAPIWVYEIGKTR